MSHFTVLVATESTNEDELHKVLLPFKEYGCGSPDDGLQPYIEFNDCTEEVLKTWKEGDHQEKYKTVEDFATSWHGYQRTPEGRYGYWHNPNDKWDWYIVGGRWTGSLILKNLDAVGAINGEPGLMTEPNSNPYLADAAYARDIDFRGMREQRYNEAATFYQRYHAAYLGPAVEPMERSERVEEIWDRYQRYGPRFGCRGVFPTMAHFQMHMRATRRIEWFAHGWDEVAELHKSSCEQYAHERASRPLAWAFVGFDGQWVERESMGWWGMSSPVDGVSPQSVADQFEAFVRTAKERDSYLWMVDCHI